MSESRPEGSSEPRAEPGAAASSAKAEVDPLIGRVINDRFKVLSVIARGGMGKVYKAEQTPLGRICALKVLSPKYEGDRDPEFHKRFFLEAATAAKLSHPNTVTVFDYGQSDDGSVYFIAMEYIEGRTLHRVLREEGPMVEGRVAYIAGQICRSLREAHGLGVVHRDLKPGNILLADRGEENDTVKVLDFGLVKDVSGTGEDLTQAGLFMGSPKYMAPEQILGGEISPRTDIYSLGVMMYEMLTGKVPFDRGANVGTLMAHVNDHAAPMRSVNPAGTFSLKMEGIVYRCLEKDAGKRFSSMKDLLFALKSVATANGAITDTHESMPMARADAAAPMRAETYTGTLLESSASNPRISASGDGRYAAPSFTDSVTNLGPAPPADTGALPSPRPKGRAYVWILAAAVAAGITIAVVLSSRRPTSIDTTAASPTTGSGGITDLAAAASGAPSGVGEPPAPPTATSSAPAVRTIRVESDPPGASVSDSGTEVCMTTPCELVWKGDAARAEHPLTLSKRGYKTVKITAAPADEKVAAKLDIITATGGGRLTPTQGTSGKGGDGKTTAKPNPYGD
jgi:eukaryotic-like serine/threonine-protein kinase